jgi:hypothetical protein
MQLILIQFLIIMANKGIYSTILLFASIFALNGCKTETDRAVVNLTFTLNKISETDSTVRLKFSFRTNKRKISENGVEYTAHVNDMLVSIIPINNNASNFVETTIQGNSQTEIDSVDYSPGELISNSRGVIIPSFHTRDSVFMSFSFVLKKDVNYLFYSTFQKTCVIEDNIQTRYNLTIRQNENIEPKLVDSEFAALQQLMNTSFISTSSFEVTNPCFQITDSYTFYRDRPVKLLYYP